MPPGVAGAGLSVVAEGDSERWVVDLGGVLVAAISPERADADDGLLLLVRPARQRLGSRRLLRLRLEPEGRLETIAEGLPAWIDSLVAVDFGTGAGSHLVAGGLGRLADLGELSSLSASGGPLAERALAVPEEFDLRSLPAPEMRRGVERLLAAVEPGHLRIWEPGGSESVGEVREVALPFTVSRSANGLRLASPPVARFGSSDELRFLAGPEAVGSTRLRTFLLPAQSELWASLPGLESVSQSWPFEIDGVPVLVVRTQASDELNLFERQRLRVLTLAADRTRAGALPALAVDLDSKRWHSTAVALGDVDGDGHQDLLAAFPEGLSGSDLVVEWWRGSGGGRFETRVHRSDLKKAGAFGWTLVLEGDEQGRPGVLLVGLKRIEWWPFSAATRDALTDRPTLAVSIPELPATAGKAGEAGGKAKKEVQVTVSSSGESAKVVEDDSTAGPLGVVELDRRPGFELLAVQGSGNGAERLILVRSRPQ